MNREIRPPVRLCRNNGIEAADELRLLARGASLAVTRLDPLDATFIS
jgi:hypothetical protein